MRAWLWLAAGLASAADLTPDQIRLARIRYHMVQTLNRLPNYTCTETIERSLRQPRSRKFQLLDTIRIEVALVNGAELFAWPGSVKFDDRKISDMVDGAIGNGAFALHAKSVFGGFADFKYLGESTDSGARRFRYEYNVPLERSGYELRSNKTKSARVAYSGSFEVEAESLDLRILSVHAQQIPKELGIASAADTMRYRRVPIGNDTYLLPESSELVMSDVNGFENRNITNFAGCRQYGGESTISFDDPPPESAAPPVVAPQVITLPVGLVVETAIDTRIAHGQIAVGDPIVAKLTSASKLKGRVMIPKGAIVKGRVAKLVKGYQRTEMLRADLVWDHLEFPGAVAEVNAVVEDVGPIGLRSLRVAVDKQGIIYITGTNPALERGLRVVMRLREPQTGKEQ